MKKISKTSKKFGCHTSSARILIGRTLNVRIVETDFFDFVKES